MTDFLQIIEYLIIIIDIYQTGNQLLLLILLRQFVLLRHIKQIHGNKCGNTVCMFLSLRGTCLFILLL